MSLTTSANRVSNAPNVCLEPCNDALDIALRVGKHSDICEEGSRFRVTYNRCAICLEGYSGSEQARVPQGLNQFLDFCELRIEYATEVFALTDGKSTTLVYVLEAPTAPPSRTTAERTTSASRTSPASRTSTSSSSISSESPTDTGQDLSANDNDDDTGMSRSNVTWIAGSIVGLLIILAVLLYLCYRRRKRSKRIIIANGTEDVPEKAQLHGDCIPPPEKHHAELDSDQIHEMDAGTRHELDGEVRHEKETVEKKLEVTGDTGQSKGGAVVAARYM